MADRGRPASMRELTSVDLVIHVAMAAATHILVGHDKYGARSGSGVDLRTLDSENPGSNTVPRC